MEIREQLSRQRVKHIASSYQLGGNEAEEFDSGLEELLNIYSTPFIELALVEVLVANWSTVPLVRGMGFLSRVRQQLQVWEGQPITSRITPEQFQQITGLDPSPVFGPSEFPSTQPTVRPF